MTTKKSIHSGFTLMEMSIVSTLVVILGLVVLVGINPLTQILKGYDTRRKADLAALKIAFEAYYADHDCYPPSSILNNCGSDDLAPYLNKIPCDPNDNSPYDLQTPPDNSSTCPQQYAIYTPLISFFSRLAETIPTCPGTYAVYSSNMTNSDLADGCGGLICQRAYGCRAGACVLMATDGKPSCSPYSCDSDCGGDCTIQTPEGDYSNECR